MANQIAGEGLVWVCMACGKRSKDLYGNKAINFGWDESCMLNAIVCEEASLNISPTTNRVMSLKASQEKP